MFLDWLKKVLLGLGGSATVVEVSKAVWRGHEGELRTMGDLFYTWQYDLRWAANSLRRMGILKPHEASPRGVWELATKRNQTC